MDTGGERSAPVLLDPAGRGILTAMVSTDRDAALGLLAARAMLDRLDAMTARADGVRRAEDIEDVHQMRVASRRLRAALALFEPVLPARRVEGWVKDVRRVTRRLGEARDLDVQIAFVEDFTRRHTEHAAWQPGLRRLLLRLRQRRERVQPRLRAAMDRFGDSDIETELGAALRQLTALGHMAQADEHSEAVFERARDTVRARVQEVVSFADEARDPTHTEQAHALRIAAKRLRYTLEVFAPAFDGALRPYIQIVKRLQTVLGEVHDCDVWIDWLPRFLDDERRRTVRFYGAARDFRKILGGIEALREDRRARREQLFARFLRLWDATYADRTWPALVALVDEAAARDDRSATAVPAGEPAP